LLRYPINKSVAAYKKLQYRLPVFFHLDQPYPFLIPRCLQFIRMGILRVFDGNLMLTVWLAVNPKIKRCFWRMISDTMDQVNQREKNGSSGLNVKELKDIFHNNANPGPPAPGPYKPTCVFLLLYNLPEPHILAIHLRTWSFGAQPPAFCIISSSFYIHYLEVYLRIRRMMLVIIMQPLDITRRAGSQM